LTKRLTNDLWRREARPAASSRVVVGPVVELVTQALVRVYAAALRHQQHLEDGCDRSAWDVLARHLIERAVWSANSPEEAVRDGRPL
jgi:hypothetical protein